MPATRVLGFGFATPYLGVDPRRGAGARLHAGRAGGDRLAGRGGLRRRRWWRRIRCRFPIPSIDLVILVHALEMSDRPQCADGGAPARADQRRPAHRRGAEPAGTVGEHRPLALRLRPALFARPAPAAFSPRWASRRRRGRRRCTWRRPAGGRCSARRGSFDRIGRIVWPAFAGVIVVSAVKRTVQGVAVRVRPRLSPALRPALAAEHRRGRAATAVRAGRSPGRRGNSTA